MIGLSLRLAGGAARIVCQGGVRRTNICAMQSKATLVSADASWREPSSTVVGRGDARRGRWSLGPAVEALALPMPLYAAACAALLQRAAARAALDLQELLSMALLTWSVYLLHAARRAPPTAQLDPQQEHRRWAARRVGALWTLAVAAGFGAILTLVQRKWWLGAFVPAGWLAVWLYSGPGVWRGRRIRETLWVKNLAVGGGLAAAAWTLTLVDVWDAGGGARALGGVTVGAAGLALLVASDAAVSDARDRRLDAREGASTVWLALTRAGACRAVLVGAGVGAATLAWAWTVAGEAWWSAALWGGLAVVSTAATCGAPAPKRRLWIELRMPLLAALAWTLAQG